MPTALTPVKDIMRIWTYLSPSPTTVTITPWRFFTLSHTVSRLFKDSELLDEQSVHHMDGVQTFDHTVPIESSEPLRIEVGYVGWWSVGIAVFEGEQTVYESHPGKNVRFAEGMMQGLAPADCD